MQKYLSKISGPLLDRIDIHIEMPAVDYKDVMYGKVRQPSKQRQENNSIAIDLQNKRFDGLKVSRTIADLCGSDQIETLHVTEVLQFRCLDKYLS